MKKCKTCEFEEEGVCHKNPPTVVIIEKLPTVYSDHKMPKIETHFPEAKSWCGCWEEKKSILKEKKRIKKYKK